MTKPSSAVAITPGVGTSVATHTIDGKEYQVLIIAGPSGHLLDTLPTYYYNRTGAAGAANQRTIDIFNATGSGVVLKIKKLFLFHDGSTITGVIHRFEVRRSTAVGTGGTVIAPTKADSANAALPAGVTCRTSATGGATTSDLLFNICTSPEESLPAASLHCGLNWMPEGENIQELILRENEGMVVTQITSNTAGIWHALLVVGVE